MSDVLTIVLMLAALGCALWAVVLIVVNRPFVVNRPYGLALAGALAVLEFGLLVQVVVGVVGLLTDDRDISGLSFVGYLVGPVLIVPLAAVWSIAERSRWGPGVVVIGCLAVPVMILRLRDIWAGHG